MDTKDVNIPEAMSGCIDACQRCHQACLELSTHLLDTQSGFTKSKLFAALVACIGTSRIVAEMLLTDPRITIDACQTCAAVCRTAADLCKGYPGAQACVDACTECAGCCDRVGEKLAA